MPRCEFCPSKTVVLKIEGKKLVINIFMPKAVQKMVILISRTNVGTFFFGGGGYHVFCNSPLLFSPNLWNMRLYNKFLNLIQNYFYWLIPINWMRIRKNNLEWILLKITVRPFYKDANNFWNNNEVCRVT